MAVVAGVTAEDAAIEMVIMDSAPANLVIFELVERASITEEFDCPVENGGAQCRSPCP